MKEEFPKNAYLISVFKFVMQYEILFSMTVFQNLITDIITNNP
jgi:hypothetical protein